MHCLTSSKNDDDAKARLSGLPANKEVKVSSSSSEPLNINKPKARDDTLNRQHVNPMRKPLNVMSAILGECLCEPFNQSSGGLEKGLTPSAQFVELHGIEFIGLGAVEDELSAAERVYDTLEQLTTRTERMISIGYLVDQEDQLPATSSSDSSSYPTNNHSSTKVTETIPLDVWSREYPNDRHMSRSVKRIITHIKTKNFKAALADFQKEFENQKRHPNRNNNSYMVGITAHNMGVVCALAGIGDLSLSYFKEAVGFKREAFGAEHLEVAVSLDELGIQYFAREQFDDALAAFNDSRKIRSKSLGPSHPEISMALNNIGCCNFQMGNCVNAMLTLQEARELHNQHQSKAQGNSGVSVELDLLHMAIVVSNLGYLKLHLKQYEEASACFEEALLIQQSVLGDAHNHRAIRDTRSNLDFTNAFHS